MPAQPAGLLQQAFSRKPKAKRKIDQSRVVTDCRGLRLIILFILIQYICTPYLLQSDYLQ